MHEFDIIVIGAGPAGCYAALAAAARGCRVGLFEEHPAIGWLRHDPGWLMECEFTKSVVDVVGRSVPWTRIKEFRIYQAESGDLIESSALGGYLMRRDLLDKEIASLAIKAGARLYLRNRVTKMVRGEGRIEGIETSSTEVPSAKAKIFICADGLRSSGGGFAASEGLCARKEERPGISYLLENIETTGGVVENFLSSDPLLNYRCFFAHRDGQSFMAFRSSQALEELKARKDNAVSRKIQNAVASEMIGFARSISGKYGQYFKTMVRDNVLFVGDASGGAGNIHGMIQGHFAGEIAAAAIRENNIGQERLLEYQKRVIATLGKAPFHYFTARDDFGTFDTWFHEFKEATKGIRATELTGSLSGQ